MNRKLKLALLASPTIFTSLMSIVGVINPAHAASPVIRMNDGLACIKHPHISYDKFVCTRTTQRNQLSRTNPTYNADSIQSSDKNIAMLDFSEQESNKAIALFGCDCPYCMNALRALQNLKPMVY